MKIKKNYINRVYYLVEIIIRFIDRLYKIKKNFISFIKVIYFDKVIIEISK